MKNLCVGVMAFFFSILLMSAAGAVLEDPKGCFVECNNTLSCRCSSGEGECGVNQNCEKFVLDLTTKVWECRCHNNQTDCTCDARVTPDPSGGAIDTPACHGACWECGVNVDKCKPHAMLGVYRPYCFCDIP